MEKNRFKLKLGSRLTVSIQEDYDSSTVWQTVSFLSKAMCNLSSQEFVDNNVSSFKKIEVHAQSQVTHLTDTTKYLVKTAEANHHFDEVKND